MTTQSAEPRLMIQKMVLHNFKSYAGVKEIGPFHKCFSSVVGPNGSGKSNVIDALLFVFGKRSTQIRLKRLCELIHKSTEHTDIQECRVDIHFADIVDTDDADGYVLVPNSEFIISRSANQQSLSKYYINSRSATMTDVTDLLRAKKIDIDNNRFLILQGEVEQIAMMKPRAAAPGEIGILEYLEDIIGTNVYVEKIEETGKKLESIGEDREEKMRRLKVSEKEKDILEPAKNEAIEYQMKENEMNMRQCELFQLQQADCVVKKQDVDAKKQELASALSTLQSELSAMADTVKSHEQQYKHIQQEHDQTLETMTKCKADFAAFERKDIKYRELIKFKNANIKKLKTKISKNKQEIEDMNVKIQEDNINLPKYEKQLQSLTALKDSEEKNMEELFELVKSKTEDLRISMEKEQKKLIPYRQELNAVQQKIDILKNDINMLTNKVTSAQSQSAEAAKLLEAASASLIQKTNQIKDMKAMIEKSEKQIKQLESDLSTVNAEESELTKKRAELLSYSEDMKCNLSESKNSNDVLKALMDPKNKLTGVFGRLGDLGIIDAKYDVAITTAVPNLDRILVDSTHTGEKCIKFLKAYNIGRAGFLALDQQKFPASVLQPMTAPEGCVRLFDLITVQDERFKQAMYFACRDTLVAKDMEQAKRVGYGEKRWRVVTLDGKMIETSGAMSGGGATVKRGGMGSKFVNQKHKSKDEGGNDSVQLKDVEKELRAVEEKIAALRARKSSLESQLKTANRQLSDFQLAYDKVSVDVEETTKEIDQYKEKIETLKKNLKLSAADQANLSNFESELASHEKNHDKIAASSSKIEETIAALQKKIMEAGGDKYQKAKEKLEKITNEIDELNSNINKIKVGGESGAKKAKKLNSELEESEKALQADEQEIEKLLSEFKQIEEDAMSVHLAFKEAEALVAQKEAELEKIQSKYEEFKQKINAIRSKEIDMLNKQDEYDKAWKMHNEKEKSYAKKIAELVNQINHDLDLQSRATNNNVVEEKSAAAPSDARASRSGRRVQQVIAGPYTVLTPEQVSALDKNKLEYAIAMLQEDLAQIKPNMNAITEYLKKEQEYNARVAAVDEITKQRDDLRREYEDLRKRRLDEFMSGFSIITLKLKEMYQMLTLGGDAELELVDSLDPFSEGIIFSVRPPKKSWKNIQNLSGGEKTLSSLALVFALHHYKPTPLYVMDEIDAALDFKNVSIVANYIKERTKNAQFIIISLRNNMFELADRLVGIYKTNHITKSITIDPRMFVVPKQSTQQEAEQQLPQASF